MPIYSNSYLSDHNHFYSSITNLLTLKLKKKHKLSRNNNTNMYVETEVVNRLTGEHGGVGQLPAVDVGLERVDLVHVGGHAEDALRVAAAQRQHLLRQRRLHPRQRALREPLALQRHHLRQGVAEHRLPEYLDLLVGHTRFKLIH